MSQEWIAFATKWGQQLYQKDSLQQLQHSFSIWLQQGWGRNAMTEQSTDPICNPCRQTLRLQQVSPAAIHLVGMMMPRELSIISDKEWMDGPRWLMGKWSRFPLEYMLVTSDPEMLEPLPFISFDEFRVPLSDCRTSELCEPEGWDSCPSPTFFAFIPLFTMSEIFVFKKRPPHPLGRRIAWRWRDSCIYGCRNKDRFWIILDKFSRICIWRRKGNAHLISNRITSWTKKLANSIADGH